MMGKSKKLEIELLSDLCAASGEVHNSLIDCDVTYDEYGIPYIPAKRLKGCIREAALELFELGIITKEQYDKLFGEQGRNRSAFSLSNARIRDYEDVIDNIKNYRGYDFVNPQNVLELYTDIRIQTAVNLETGVAENNSLRTMRVIQKGLIFEADCMLENEADVDLLTNAVSLVKHIGVSRTRGFGLVNMTLKDSCGEKNKNQHVQIGENFELKEWNQLRYKIHLNSAMICKSEIGNQAVTQDYIAGSKVLGLIAGALGQEKYHEIMEKGIIVSNAYIMHGNERCLPCRVSLQKEKDQAGGNAVDMLYDPDVKNKQMTPLGTDYCTEDYREVGVGTEISYHHQRPLDKSIGRATGADDGSGFYQLAAISAGQSFCGYIYADKEAAASILDSVNSLGKVRMGYGRSSEFGDVDFVIDSINGTNCKSDQTEKNQIVNDQILLLESDVILYNFAGMPTTELPVLKSYLEDVLQVDDLEIQKPFLKFTTVGGYNVTWGARKPIFQALAKGSVMKIHSDKGFDRVLLKSRFIGERTAEGYGEIKVEDLKNTSEVTVQKETSTEDLVRSSEQQIPVIIHQLLDNEADRRVKLSIRKKLVEETPGFLKENSEVLNACVAKIRLLLKTEKTYEELKNQVNEIADTNKKAVCTKIVNFICPDTVPETGTKEKIGIVSKVCSKIEMDYGIKYISSWSEEEKYKKVYHYYMIELKYRNKSLRRTGIDGK